MLNFLFNFGKLEEPGLENRTEIFEKEKGNGTELWAEKMQSSLRHIFYQEKNKLIILNYLVNMDILKEVKLSGR